jgi:hypothetical protein
MGKYGGAAVLAANLYREHSASSPINAWEMAVAVIFPSSRSSQAKSCPRSAFLGLCESGSITGIPTGRYCNSIQNKKYALKGLALLKEKPVLSNDEKALWQHVMAEEDNVNKTPNHQMDVVISIWNAGLICG